MRIYRHTFPGSYCRSSPCTPCCRDCTSPPSFSWNNSSWIGSSWSSTWNDIKRKSYAPSKYDSWRCVLFSSRTTIVIKFNF